MMVCSDVLTGCVIRRIVRKIAKLILQTKVQQNPVLTPTHFYSEGITRSNIDTYKG